MARKKQNHLATVVIDLFLTAQQVLTLNRAWLGNSAHVDVQRDRLEASIWAWTQDRQSRLVEHRSLAGNPFEAADSDELCALLGETRRHVSGHRLPIATGVIDSGDGMTNVEVRCLRAQGGHRAGPRCERPG